MPAISTIEALDSEATPVAHNFVPVSSTPTRNVLANVSAANTPMGQEKLVIDYSQPTAQRPTYRIKLNLAYPIEVLDSDTGLYSVAHTARAVLDFTVPEAMIQGDRENFYEVFRTILSNNTEISGYVGDLLPMY